MTPRQNVAESHNSPYGSKQYWEYGLSAIKYCAESIKNREYLTEFEAKFEKSLKNE
jgi:hypothetical protein